MSNKTHNLTCSITSLFNRLFTLLTLVMIVAVLTPAPGYGQAATFPATPQCTVTLPATTTTGTSAWINLSQPQCQDVHYWTMTWYTFTSGGTVPTCMVKAQQAVVQASPSDLIVDQSCTSTGTVTNSATAETNFVRINLDTKTGAGTTSVVLSGYRQNPFGTVSTTGGGGGGGGGAVTMASGAVAAGAYSAGSVVSGALVSGALASGALSTGSISSGAVASGAVSSGAFASGAVGSGAIASGAVSSGAVASGAIASGALASGALAPGSVGSGAIATGALATGAVSSGAIASGALASGALASGALSAGSVSSGAVVSGAILSGALAPGSISSGALASGALASGAVSSGAVVSGAIASGALASGSIASGAIASGALASGSISANAAAVGAFPAQAFAVGAIPPAPGPLKSGVITSAMTGTTSTSLVSATASNYLYITWCKTSNGSTTVSTDIALQDGNGGTTIDILPAPAAAVASTGGNGGTYVYPTPLKVPTIGNALFAANITTGASTKVSCGGFTSTVSY